MNRSQLRAQFVELMPEALEEGVIYVSDRHRLAAHRCCCGCGSEVITPLSPAEWKLDRRGDAVTLAPSIGNWDFPCQSHYFIRGNRVIWAAPMSATEIDAVRLRDQHDKARYIEQVNAAKDVSVVTTTDDPQGHSFWARATTFLKGLLGL